MFELLCLLGDLFLQRRLTLGEPVLQFRLTLGELRLEFGLTLGEFRLQLGLALVGGAAQLGHAGRGFPGERFLALGEQALRLRLVLLELGLELLTGRADARLEFGLALHQVGGVRCLQAVDLGARDAQFLAEDARLLLLGPQDAELVADVHQLARRVREFGLRGLRRLAGVERLDVGRVQVLLHLLGTLCIRLQRVELATGQRQLAVCAPSSSARSPIASCSIWRALRSASGSPLAFATSAAFACSAMWRASLSRSVLIAASCPSSSRV